MPNETEPITTTPPEAETPPERPDWLPERYADEAAFVKAFEEGEKLRGRQGEELGTLRGEIDALTAALEEAQQTRQQVGQQDAFATLASQIGDAYEQGDYARALALQSSLNSAQFGQMLDERLQQLPAPPEQDVAAILGHAEQNLRNKYGEDFDRLYERTAEVYGQNPQLRPVQGKPMTQAEVERGIEFAFRLAREEDLVTQHSALQKEREAAEASRRAKEQAQSLTGSGPRPLPKSEQEKVFDELRGAAGQTFRPSAAR